jgi:4-amino-4-deoxy-L-arabinose transferase-like glycosyltransferase
MDNLSSSLNRSLILVILLAIILSGAFYRFWGLSSVYQRVDDIPLAKHTERIYHGDWRPNPVYYYPIFFNYLVAVGLRGLSALLKLRGAYRGAGLYPFTFDQILLAARLSSALLGSLTILLVYAIGKKLYSNKNALLASFLFSVSFIHIIYSHQIVLDVPMTFFFALALYFCTRLFGQRKWLDYILAGLACGVAIATKYNGIFILAALVLAHLLGAPPGRHKALKTIVNFKIGAAGLSVLGGFFLAHPFALLHFKRFISTSYLLISVVHETEAYLKPIQARTGVEYLQYNKYVLALKNILIAEGPLFLALILLGIAAVFILRNRKTTFLGLSGLAYFLGALGFLGFSRFRDLPAFALFYAFFGMLGLRLAFRLLPKTMPGKAALGVGLAVLISALEFSTLAKTYILWENDTTEVAERWIRRNIPEGSYFGKEWFAPPLAGPGYRYPSLSRPFLFSSGFAPYNRFDFIITSSAADAHFVKNEKFYPDIVRLYNDIRAKDELVKSFYFRDIEYKNPEINLFDNRSPKRRKQRLSLPTAIPFENPEREFEMVDGSPYGKSVMTFFLEGDQEVKRIVISRHKIPSVAVFVSSAEGEGEVTIRNFFIRKRLNIRTGSSTYVIFRPRLSPSSKGAQIKICYDEFDIASEFLRLGNWAGAKTYFLKALENRPKPRFDLEIFFYLALCSKKLGQEEEARYYLLKASADPMIKRYISLIGSSSDEEEWKRRFERFSGVNLRLLEQTLGNKIGSTEFEQSAQKAGDGFCATSPGKRFLPQAYRVELRFSNPARIDGLIGELEVVSGEGPAETRAVTPIVLNRSSENGLSIPSFSFPSAGSEKKTRFIVKLDKTKEVVFEGLWVYPNIRDFFLRKSVLFRELIEALPGER